ncbi:Flp pilus assembly protein TadG [Aquamicrobium terrae]
MFRAGALLKRAFKGPRNILPALAGFRADRRGVAAIEFAFIAPVLLIMYFMTMEISQGIETSKKISRVGSMVADLIAQQGKTVTKGDVDNIMKIAQSTLMPYNRSSPTIIVTGIQMSGDTPPKPVITWSRKVVGDVYSGDAEPNTVTTVPAGLATPNTFLVRVESKLDYRPVVTWAAGDKKLLGLTSAFDNLPMSEAYYLRPRITQAMECPDCN